MNRTLCRLVLYGIVLLVLISCDDMIPGPSEAHRSINADGSGFRDYDYRLKHDHWGRPYYISDELVFQVSSKIFRRTLDDMQMWQLTPDNLQVTDQQYLAIDNDRQKLYFAANNSIYSINFDGRECTNLSVGQEGMFRAPALSDCRNYLTAIRDGKIMRLDLQRGVWSELEGPAEVDYALYVSSSNEYLYYDKTAVPSECALWQYVPDTQASTQIMSLIIDNDFSAIWGASPDRRYFALQVRSGYYNISSGEQLLLYDRISGQILQINKCFSFAFDNSSSKFYYSRQKWGMADLNCLELETGDTQLLWDGYLSQTSYSLSINRIYLRADGQRMFLSGYTANVKDIEEKESYLCTQ